MPRKREPVADIPEGSEGVALRHQARKGANLQRRIAMAVFVLNCFFI